MDEWLLYSAVLQEKLAAPMRDTCSIGKVEKSSRLSSRDYNALMDLIESCGKCKDLYRVRSVHIDALQKELVPRDIYATTALINTYAKCGALQEAQRLFDDLPIRDSVAWNALIAGYAQFGLSVEVLNCLRQMQDDCISPDVVTYVCILKGCSSTGSLVIGEKVHALVKKQGLLEKNMILGNTLVDMYAKCGELTKAQEVFDEMVMRDVVSWNALIGGYAQHGHNNESFNSFRQMRNDGISPDAVTFICVLKACTSTGCLDIGEWIHVEVNKEGLLEKDILLSTTLLDMYAKCGDLRKAQEVFDKLPIQNVVSWNALISLYVQQNLINEALNCFRQMQDDGITPDSVTFICILKGCSSTASLKTGEVVHAKVCKQGLLAKNMVLGNALVDMYAKCGKLGKAQELLYELPAQSNVSWNGLIAGYVHNCLDNEVLSCFRQMQDEGISPNAVTFMCVLKACSSIESLEIGEEIHAEISKKQLLDKDIELANTLMDMYAKCGELRKAQKIFYKLPVRTVVSWNGLIAGCIQHGFDDEALNYFRQMQDDGIFSDTVTFICVLKAHGNLGCVKIGEEIHAEVIQQGLLEDIVLGNTLVDMYAKCGKVVIAQKIFYELPVRSTVSWNELMAGYANLGQGKSVLDLLMKMTAEDTVPDLATFIVMLTACSHAGLVQEGRNVFDDMKMVYHLSPTIDHFICLVDIFSRAGHFDPAVGLLKYVLSSDRFPLSMGLLGACLKWVNVELGKWAFEQSLRVDENCAATYVCMGNIYAAAVF